MLTDLFEVLGQVFLVLLIASMAFAQWWMDVPLPVTRRAEDRRPRKRRQRDTREVRRSASAPTQGESSSRTSNCSVVKVIRPPASKKLGRAAELDRPLT